MRIPNEYCFLHIYDMCLHMYTYLANDDVGELETVESVPKKPESSLEAPKLEIIENR